MRTIEVSKGLSHPTGLWTIALTSTLLCFGFGVLNSLLVLYATGVLGIASGHAYLLFASYNALLFTMPLAGGYLAELFGYRRVLLSGTMLCALALLLLSYEKIQILYWGLALYTIGVGLFIPAYLVLIGKLYAKTDKRRESAFTLVYIIINLGFLIAGISSGYLARYLGYSWTFRVSAIITFLIFPLYIWRRNSIKPYRQRNIDPQLKWSAAPIWSALVGACLALLAIAAWFLEHTGAGDFILIALSLIVSVGVIYLAQKQSTKAARHKLYAFLILAYIAIGFWSLYMLEPSLLTIFIKDNVNRVFLHSIIPPSAYYGLDPFFIIVIGLAFSFLWRYLAKRNANPSLPVKFSFSLFLMGLGFLMLVVGIIFANQQGYTNMSWLILAYLLLSSAELLISPIGFSMVDRLAPEGMEGRMMGVWQLFTGASAVLSGYLAQFAVVPETLSREASNPIYMKTFEKIGSMALIIALMAFILIPKIKKLIKS